MTSTPNDLTARLQRRLESERPEIGETAVSELLRLGKSLRSVANDALRSIEADMATATGRLSGRLPRGSCQPICKRYGN